MSDPTYFFLHIMKTGGTSFLQHVHDTFAPEQIEPMRAGRVDEPTVGVYGSMQRLRRLSAERRREIRVYAGHLPYMATAIIEPDVTLTILRDPVDRAVSMLRQIQRGPQGSEGERSLEELYETSTVRPMLIQDYMSKLFAMTEADLAHAAEWMRALRPDADPETSIDVAHMVSVPMDAARLDDAKANLEQVELVGLQSHYDEFLTTLSDRYGWRITTGYRRRVAGPSPAATSALCRRIAADNALDVELYRYAEDLHARRRRT